MHDVHSFWIVEIMSVMFLMPAQECFGTVVMRISLKLLIFQKVYILERESQKIEN